MIIRTSVHRPGQRQLAVRGEYAGATHDEYVARAGMLSETARRLQERRNALLADVARVPTATSRVELRTLQVSIDTARASLASEAQDLKQQIRAFNETAARFGLMGLPMPRICLLIESEG